MSALRQRAGARGKLVARRGTAALQSGGGKGRDNMAIEDDIAAYEPANEQEEVDKQVILSRLLQHN